MVFASRLPRRRKRSSMILPTSKTGTWGFLGASPSVSTVPPPASQERSVYVMNRYIRALSRSLVNLTGTSMSRSLRTSPRQRCPRPEQANAQQRWRHRLAVTFGRQARLPTTRACPASQAVGGNVVLPGQGDVRPHRPVPTMLSRLTSWATCGCVGGASP